MSTVKLNEADLLRMGFTRANVAALRQIIDALGSITPGDTLAEVIGQVGAIPEGNGTALQAALDSFQQALSVELALSQQAATIEELRREVANLRSELDDTPARVAELAKEIDALRIDLAMLRDPSAILAETNKTLALKANVDSPAFTTSVGFNGSAAIAKQTVTGAKGGNVALANLCTALATVGLITDSTT